MMKKRKHIAMLAVAGIVALPLVFVAFTQRTDNGAVSTYTLRFTQFRMVLSNSGNACFSRQETSAPPEQIAWSVSRKNRVTWCCLGIMMLYLDSPRLFTGTST